MTHSKHGKKQKNPKGFKNQRDNASNPGGLGFTRQKGEIAGNEPNSASDQHRSRRLGDRLGGSEERDSGGILRQLRELREEALSFVDAHSARLEARLAEDKKHRAAIVQKIEILESQILMLEEESNT